MKRIVAPMVGGMISSTVLPLLVIPAICALWREAGLRREALDRVRMSQYSNVPTNISKVTT
jgi:hypothetical protein